MPAIICTPYRALKVPLTAPDAYTFVAEPTLAVGSYSPSIDHLSFGLFVTDETKLESVSVDASSPTINHLSYGVFTAPDDLTVTVSRV